MEGWSAGEIAGVVLAVTFGLFMLQGGMALLIVAMASAYKTLTQKERRY